MLNLKKILYLFFISTAPFKSEQHLHNSRISLIKKDFQSNFGFFNQSEPNLKSFSQFRNYFKNSTHSIIKSSNKFGVNVKPFFWKTDEIRHLVQLHPEYKRSNATGILQATQFNNEKSFPSLGFVQTVMNCDGNSHNLVLRPDDIWTAIVHQFSFYLKGNSESLRAQFVKFHENKRLNVRLSSGKTRRRVNLVNSEEFVEEIKKHLVAEWLLPRFSTTTKDDIITNGLLLISANYPHSEELVNKDIPFFKSEILCGIPEIMLLGRWDDWKEIGRRIGRLGSLGLGPEMNKWADMVSPVLEEFVFAKDGVNHYQFWEQICRLSKLKLCESSKMLDGWISIFNTFNENGKWVAISQPYNSGGAIKWPLIHLSNLASGVVQIPITFIRNGKEKDNSIVFAGHMGQTVLDDGVSIRPLSGWAIPLTL